MTIAEARTLFDRVCTIPEKHDITYEELEKYGEAIDFILNMPTHNSVKKTEWIRVCKFLWNQIFEKEQSVSTHINNSIKE